MPVPTEFGSARISRNRQGENTNVAAGAAAAESSPTEHGSPRLAGVAGGSKISCVQTLVRGEHNSRLGAEEAALGLDILHTLATESV